MTPDKMLRVGWKLAFSAGLIVGLAGLAAYVLNLVSIFSPRAEWRSLQGTSSVSFGGLQNFDIRFADLWLVENHLAAVNLTATGVFICLIAAVGLRRAQRWAFFALLFAVLWVGGNDSIATIIIYVQHGNILPVPLLPFILGVVGLALSAKAVLAAPAPTK